MSEIVKITHIEDTISNIEASKRAGLIALATDEGITGEVSFYDSSLNRHRLATMDVSGAVSQEIESATINELQSNNIIVGDKVGIGTDNPTTEIHTYKLSANAENRVESDLTTGIAQFKAVNNVDKNCTLGIRGNTAADYYTIKANDAYVLTDSASTRLMLQATSDIMFSPGQATAMCLKASGNVGINNTSPTSRLDVDGDIETTGIIYQGDPTTDGSTRLRADGAGNVYHETRVAGSWILA